MGLQRSSGRRRQEQVAPQAAPRGTDSHREPGAQQAEVGDRSGDLEHWQPSVHGELGGAGDERADRERQAPLRQGERHAASDGVDRQCCRQSDPQHRESPDRHTVEDREDAHAAGHRRGHSQRRVSPEKSCAVMDCPSGPSAIHNVGTRAVPEVP